MLFELPGDSIEGLKLKRRECRTVAVLPQHHSLALFQGFKKRDEDFSMDGRKGYTFFVKMVAVNAAELR